MKADIKKLQRTLIILIFEDFEGFKKLHAAFLAIKSIFDK
jgi:hypothetical protein